MLKKYLFMICFLSAQFSLPVIPKKFLSVLVGKRKLISSPSSANNMSNSSMSATPGTPEASGVPVVVFSEKQQKKQLVDQQKPLTFDVKKMPGQGRSGAYRVVQEKSLIDKMIRNEDDFYNKLAEVVDEKLPEKSSDSFASFELIV